MSISFWGLNSEVEAVARLLDLGTTVEAKDEKGWTAILSAAYEGHGDVVALLIEEAHE